jgi:hypothetical protein
MRPASALALLWFLLPGGPAHGAVDCPDGVVRARVVALDQPMYLNRLGSYIPGGMIFALEGDVVAPQGSSAPPGPGNATLRPGKRPRPLVLRVNRGQCLDVVLKNWLSPTVPAVDPPPPATRLVALHGDGLEWRQSAADDGSFVGKNASSLLAPSVTETRTYRLRAREEGTFLLYSTGDTVSVGAGFFPVGGQLSQGLFGAIHVEPPGAEHYRSQVTHADLELAKKGYTADRQPLLDWDARYPDDPRRYGALAGRPILRLTDPRNEEIVHSDLTAVITGPGRGEFLGDAPTFAPVAASPDRRQPYREITIVYHEVGDVAVQAFDSYRNPGGSGVTPETILAQVIANGDDGFAINYGVAGIVNEILANRFEVGPMQTCAECKFEEFFLSSWAVGDPAMVLDTPTWVPGGPDDGTLRPDAVVQYPDDPSNVYHSYLWDHVKFRVLHGGASLHHLHHQHAQQWLHSPDSDRSDYLDSQAIGPGSGFTLEMVYNGSGNKNLTVGDSIFHCHFYPHFAQGMWGLWRVHDVFEAGTPLDGDGRPVGRALPDGEILAGTPIPALVPLPTRPMAPMPAEVRIDRATGQVDRSVWPGGVPPKNPGYPFFIPGIAGSRAPHPPLDLAFDGGLPRHIVERTGNQWTEEHNYQNFAKDNQVLSARRLDEQGEPEERVAMDFHSRRGHPSFTPEGKPASFTTNGLGPVAGAPFADPCVTLEGKPVAGLRVYKAANVQHDVVLSKEGWHFPQLRMITLWEDVLPTLNNERPAQPFFFRASSGDCIEYQHTNLVPDYYELDAFQVRTPTDILGQHIHLVKFDVTSSDGAANGWNYEDGAFSPREVQGRITAINRGGGLLLPGGSRQTLQPEPHPFFGKFPQYRDQWLGAQTEIQRWYADPLLDNDGLDRTLRTVFTHDHFSPSTHQQAGLYAGLLVEPRGSRWFEPATGQELGVGRMDGGPTSWQANIDLTPQPGSAYQESFREFGLLLADFQLAYEPGYGYPKGAAAKTTVEPFSNPDHFQFGSNVDNVNAALSPPNNCPGGEAQFAPCPQLVSQFVVPSSLYSSGLGEVSINYRMEPLQPRGQGTHTGLGPDPTDPANLFLSLPRPYQGPAAYPTLNTQTPSVGAPGIQSPLGPLPPLTAGMFPTDPYTPLLRAYMGDPIELAVLAGAHLELKNFTVHGVRWRAENFWPDSGWRASQHMGLSEHFEFDFTAPTVRYQNQADFLYAGGAAISDLHNGAWGLLRAYSSPQEDLRPLLRSRPPLPRPEPLPPQSEDVCAPGAPLRKFEVWAVRAADVVPGGQIVFSEVAGNQVVGEESLLYVLAGETYRGQDLGGDLDLSGPKPVLRSAIGQPQPLVLRAAAGDCIKVSLTNHLPPEGLAIRGQEAIGGGRQTPRRAAAPQGLGALEEDLDAEAQPSRAVGLHPQLVELDVSHDNGFNAGLNPLQTVEPGQSITYTWYAGRRIPWSGDPTLWEWEPVEFGAINLMPADPLYQQPLGLHGALVIEPQGATWDTDPGDRTAARVDAPDGSFRELVLVISNSLNLEYEGAATACASATKPPAGTVINYRSAPLFLRDPAVFSDPHCSFFSHDISAILSNTAVGGQDPTGPVYAARAGEEVRFRLLNPGSTNQNEVFTLHGHVWQERPYARGSAVIGDNPLSNHFGAWAGHGAGNHYDVVVPSAGGQDRVPGDYLFQTFNMADFPGGMWGILRVEDEQGAGRGGAE